MSSAAAPLPPPDTEPRTSFTFKLDQITRLDSTTNYLSCWNQVSIYLHVMNISKYIDRSNPKPTDITQLATWTCNDYTAKAAIMRFLPEEFIYLANDATTDKDAWKAVENHWDSRNSATLYQTVQFFFSTKMQDTDVLTDRIISYVQKHTCIMKCCRSANDPLPCCHLVAYLKDDETKARHLLMSVSSYMENIIDYLQSKEFLTDVAVRSLLLDLSVSSNLSPNSKALNARSYKVNKVNK